MKLMKTLEENILIVAAHPDDEVLGCGGTIARLSDEGANINVLFLADGVGARGKPGELAHPECKARRNASRAACGILGANLPLYLDFPDNRLDTVPLLDVARSLEKIIADLKPQMIFTHHAGDLNVDHRIAHQAVVTASRPQPGNCVRKIYSFEIASSTEWQLPGSGPTFLPTTFVDIGKTLSKKLEALRAYEVEMRPWPHSRSIRAAEHHARWRGASAGFEAAEAFVMGRELV